MMEQASNTLRVAIMCNGMEWQLWQERVYDELLKVPGVELVLVITPSEVAEATKSLGSRAVNAHWSTVLYRKYRQAGFGSMAMRSTSMKNALAHIPHLACTPELKGHGEYFSDAQLRKIGSYAPDLIVRLGFNIIRGDILELPRYGIWSFHHGDEQKYRGGPPGLWEIMNGETTIGVVLQRLTDKLDGGYILKKGHYEVVNHSLADTIDAPLMDSAIWPAQLCRKLLRGQADVAIGTKSDTEAPVYKYPKNLQFLRFRYLLWRNKIRFHREDLSRHEEWNLGVYYHPISDLLKEHPNLNVRWLPNPAKGSFRADPFGFLHDGELIVLYEKYDGNKERGVIARVRPKPDNILKRSKTILDNAQHLSYPFIVQKDGAVYVIPESYESGQLMSYKMSADLESLEPVATLLDLPLLDPTVFEYEGLWWIMGTLQPHTNVGLYLYYSETFEGPYTPHVMNPVKSDIGNSRPAGTPFMHEGELYRPAQNSSKTYGGSVMLNRVVQLDKDDFREEFVKEIAPMPGSAHNSGIHTISAVSENITLVDGKRFVTDHKKKRANLKRKWNKLFGKA